MLALSKPGAQIALILLATLLAYWNSFGGVFQFDDYKVIVDNPAVASLGAWWHSMPGIRPLLKLSYTLNHSLAGPYELVGFHAVNLGLHASNALLLCALLRKLLPDSAAAPNIALIAALLFAVHPIHTEAVTYLSGRSMSLMATAYLGSILLHLHGRRYCSFVAFAAALTVRETALTLPLALLLIEHQGGRSIRDSWRNTRHHWLIATLGITAFALLPHYRHLADTSLHARSLGDNLITQSAAVLYLFRQWIWPFALNADPTLPIFTQWNGFWISCALSVSTLIGMGLLLWQKQRSRSRWIGFATLWFLLHLAPSNSVLPRLDIANERHLYLATAGFYLLIAFALQRLITHWPRTGTLGTAALILFLVIGTQQRNRIYHSEIAFWQNVVTRNPDNSRAYNNLGYAHARSGDFNAAWDAYSQALTLQPDDYTVHFNRLSLCRNKAEALRTERCASLEKPD